MEGESPIQPALQPKISVIVPCYNEQGTIRLLLQALYDQTYPRAMIEIIIADGQSTDRTRKVIDEFHQTHPDSYLQIVDNPKRNIPSGLNRAIEAATGTYIVRLDAHSVPNNEYIDRCIQALQKGKGDNVGGVWEIQPSNQTWAARAIATAAAHPLGVGDAKYRYGSQAQSVDTVPFGAYHRSLIDRIGPYDEALLSNEDYEFNVRVRKAGGKVWLDPEIRSIYFARRSLKELARQYWRYGYWKAQMLRRYPDTLRWRQLAALLVLSLGGLGFLSFFFPPARWLLALEILVYSSALLLAGLQSSLLKKDPAMLPGVPLAIATMHLTWGTAFIWSALQIAIKLGRGKSG